MKSPEHTNRITKQDIEAAWADMDRQRQRIRPRPAVVKFEVELDDQTGNLSYSAEVVNDEFTTWLSDGTNRPGEGLVAA